MNHLYIYKRYFLISSLPNFYKFVKLYRNNSLRIKVSLSLIGDASMMHFLFSQNILFFTAIKTVAKSITPSWINITANRSVNSVCRIHNLRSGFAGKSQWNMEAAVVSYKSGRNPRREKERRMAQGILRRVRVCLCTCVSVTRDAFRAVYHRVSSKYWFWRHICLLAERFVRPSVLLLRCHWERFQTLLQIATSIVIHR